MTSTSVTINSNYYSGNTDPLILIALKVAIETYFYNLLFTDDTNRLTYSTTDYALRKRSSNSPWDNALLPFMNYRETEISTENNRQWASFRNLKHGVYIDDLGMKVRFTPVTLQFDATTWFATDRDCNIAYQKLLDDVSGESALKFPIKINDVEVPLYGLLDYTGLQYKPSFNENEWILNNKISTINNSFKIQTMLPMISNQPSYSLTDKFILDFGRLIGVDGKTIDETYTYVLDHFNQETII